MDSEASWRSYIAGDKYHRGDVSSYVEERFVPDMQAVKHTTTQQRPVSCQYYRIQDTFRIDHFAKPNFC